MNKILVLAGAVLATAFAAPAHAQGGFSYEAGCLNISVGPATHGGFGDFFGLDSGVEQSNNCSNAAGPVTVGGGGG